MAKGKKYNLPYDFISLLTAKSVNLIFSRLVCWKISNPKQINLFHFTNECINSRSFFNTCIINWGNFRNRNSVTRFVHSQSYKSCFQNINQRRHLYLPHMLLFFQTNVWNLHAVIADLMLRWFSDLNRPSNFLIIYSAINLPKTMFSLAYVSPLLMAWTAVNDLLWPILWVVMKNSKAYVFFISFDSLFIEDISKS